MSANESPAQRTARLARQRAYRLRHKERILRESNLRNRSYRQANPEKHRASARAYYHAHAEERRARSRAYKTAHAQEMSLYNKEYRTVHREELLRDKQSWDLTNREHRRLYQQVYRAAHPDVQRTSNQRRRAAKAGTPENTLSAAQWLEIQTAQDHRCYYCGKRCKGHLTQDHIVPLFKGGAHILHNVIGACRSCNSKKHVGPPPTPVQPLLLTVAPARKKKAS